MSSRSRISAGLAISLHIGVFFLARALPPPQAHLSPPSVESRDVLDPIEVALLSDEINVNANVNSSSEKDAREMSSSLRMAFSRELRNSGNEVGAAERSSGEPSSVNPSPNAEEQPPGDTVMLFIPSPSAIGISGAGGVNPFLARGALPESGGNGVHGAAPGTPEHWGASPAPPSNAEATRRARGSIREGIASRVERGLGPEGPVLRALQDATYGSAAPVIGSAMFVAIIDSKGAIIDLRIVNTRPKGKEAEGGWDDARELARHALSKTKLDLRGSNGGAELHILVTSDYLLPSGNRPGDFPVQPGLKVSGHDMLHPKKLDANSDGPPLTVATFDLSDVGAKPRRIVHTSIESARELEAPAPASSAPAN